MTEIKKMTEGECEAHQARIAIIGAGMVGSTIAFAAMLKDLASEIILIDVDAAREEGEVMDLADGLIDSDVGSVKAGSLADCQNVDMVVITAGLAQKTGETRLDLVKKNKVILEGIIKGMGQLRDDTVVLVIANPVDVLTYLARKSINLPPSQVFGSGTYLDTSRLRYNIAQKLGVSVVNVHGYVLGEHGDSEFVPWETVNVSNKPVAELLKEEELKEIEEKTKRTAYNIIQRKKATYYGIAVITCEIIEAVLHDKKLIMPVSVEPGEFYGLKNVSLGVPAVIGRSGVEKVWPLELNEDSKQKLQTSAKILAEFIK